MIGRQIGCNFAMPPEGESWTTALCVETGNGYVKMFTLPEGFNPVGKTLKEIMEVSNKTRARQLRFDRIRNAVNRG